MGISILLAANQSLYGNLIPQDLQAPGRLALDSSASGLPQLDKYVSIADVFLPSADLGNRYGKPNTYLSPKVVSSPLRGEGRVRGINDLLRNPSQKLVIYLEDAHGVTAAQTNIAETMRELAREGNLREPWIALEGSRAGEIDHRILSVYPHLPTKNKVAEALLAKGLLNGADYFAVRYKPKAKLFGVEEGDLAEQNREAYRNFISLKPQVDQALRHLDKANSILKDRIYYGDLVELNQIAEKLEKDASRFTVHLAQLQYLGEKNKIELKKYPSLYQFLELKSLDAKITGRPDLEKERAEFSNLSRSLEAGKLFKDLDAFIIDLWNKLLFYEEARAAYFINRAVQFYKKLFAFSLTPDEYQQYVKHPELYSFEALQEKIRKYYFILRPRSLRPTAKQMLLLEEASQYPLNFYRLAEERNQFLSKNIAALLDQSPDKKVFFVAGGFHRESITAALKDMQIPYLVMTPRIANGEGQENYWRLLAKDAQNPSFPRLIRHPRGSGEPVGGIRHKEGRTRQVLWRELQQESMDSPVEPGNDVSTVALEDRFAAGNMENLLFREGVVRDIEATHSNFSAALPQYFHRLGYADKSLILKRIGPTISTQARSELRSQDYPPVVIKLGDFVNNYYASNGRQPQNTAALAAALSKVLSENLNKASKGQLKLNVNILSAYLQKIEWERETESRNAAEDLVPANIYKYPLHIGFTEMKDSQIRWRDAISRKKDSFEIIFNLEVIEEFLKAGQGMAELLIAVTLRNDFVGHILNRYKELYEGKLAEKKLKQPDVQKDKKITAQQQMIAARRYINNYNYLNVILNDRGPKEGAAPRLAFTRVLTKILRDRTFEQKTVFLENLAAELDTPGNWYLILEDFIKRGKIKEVPAIGPEVPDISIDDQENGRRFKIEEYLDEGGMGKVYLAHDRLNKRKAVVKIIDYRGKPEESMVRYYREIEALRQTSHPNIVEIYHFAPPKGKIPVGYMALEYVQGDNLGKFLNKFKERKLPLYMAFEIVLQIGEALQHAHEKGIIHRDVKPANIMVNLRNSHHVQAKLLDFGLNKFVEELAANTDTKSGTVLGTPQYIPPEQAVAKNVTPAADMYALGYVLYEMLTGRKLVHASTMMEYLLGSRHGIHPKVSELNPEIKNLAPELHNRIDLVVEAMVSLFYEGLDPASEYWDGIVSDSDAHIRTMVQTKKGPQVEVMNLKDPKVKAQALRGKEGGVLVRPRDEAALDELESLRDIFRPKKAEVSKTFSQAVSRSDQGKKKKALAREPAPTEIYDPAGHPVIPGHRKAAPSRSSLKKYLILAAAAFFVTVIGILTTVFWPGQTTGPTKSGSSQITSPSGTISYEGSMQFNGNGDAIVINSLLGQPTNVTLVALVDLKAPGKYGSEIIDIGHTFVLRADSSSNGFMGIWRISGEPPNTLWGNITFKENIAEKGRKLLVASLDNINHVQTLWINGKQVARTNKLQGVTYDPKFNSSIIGIHPISKDHDFFGELIQLQVFGKAVGPEKVKLIHEATTSSQKHKEMMADPELRSNLLLYLVADEKGIHDLSENVPREAITIRGNPIISVTHKDGRKTTVPLGPNGLASPRSELRQLPELKQPIITDFSARKIPLDIRTKTFRRSIVASNKNALLIFDYDEKLVRSLFRKSPRLPNTHVIFLKQKDQQVRSEIRAMKSTYGFEIIDSNKRANQLKPGHELERTLNHLAVASKIPVQNLGTPVIFAENFDEDIELPENLTETKAIYLRFNKHSFIRKLPERVANAVTGIALSKNVLDVFDSHMLNRKGNVVEVTKFAIQQVQDYLKFISKVARYA